MKNLYDFSHLFFIIDFYLCIILKDVYIFE